MSFDALSPGGLDYLPCRYGNSKVQFRGPRRCLDGRFVAFFGGTTTYGKYIQTPFCDSIEAGLGIICANFGSVNGGVDLLASDPFLRNVSGKAAVSVIQITSPRNMSNRFYRVHPRRNDRFVEASPLLRAMYRDIDFAEFNFTNHVLQRLVTVSPDRFELVLDELRTAWVARMRLVLSQISGKTVLLWASARRPEDMGDCIDADPAFVTRMMLDQISPMATQYVEVVSTEAAKAAGTDGMVLGELDVPAASQILGPYTHDDIATALVPVLKELI